MKKMVVIVPVYCQVDKAQNVAQKVRSYTNKYCPVGAVRHLQFQNHYRDNDCNDAITERGQTIFSHGHGPAQPYSCWKLNPDILVLQDALDLRRRIKEYSMNSCRSVSHTLCLGTGFASKMTPSVGAQNLSNTRME
jgi:hypothetical protein